MRRRVALNSRQEYVIERLYCDYAWSVAKIMVATGVKRRALENALRRRNVPMTRHFRVPDMMGMTEQAAREWFTNPGDEHDVIPDLRPASKVVEGEVAYRLRRCPKCERLLEYKIACPCGQKLYGAIPPPDPVADLREEETNR